MDPGQHVLLLNIVAGSLWHTQARCSFCPGSLEGYRQGREWR